jgi:hypothetical protein
MARGRIGGLRSLGFRLHSILENELRKKMKSKIIIKKHVRFFS